MSSNERTGGCEASGSEAIGNIIGYALIEILSLLFCLVVSFFIWVVIPGPGGDSGPGEGFGYIIILLIGGPIWIALAFITPMMVYEPSVGISQRIKHVAISFFTPIIAAVGISALLSVLIISRP
jgi:hypothetical protein